MLKLLKNNLLGNLKELIANIKDNYLSNVISVSKIKTLIVPKFDGETVAAGLESRYFNDPTSKYYQRTKETILESWADKGAESKEYGKLLDSTVEQILEIQDEEEFEMFILDNNYEYDERFAEIVDTFMKFYTDLFNKGYIEYVGREIPVYYNNPGNDLSVIGRIDALFYNRKANKWMIIDWKSDEKIKTDVNCYTERCLGPAKSLYNLSWYLYTIQLHTYKAALLQNYLPEGTKPEDVEVYICNIPQKPYQDENDLVKNNHNYKLFGEAFNYDEELLNKIYVFSMKKDKLSKKKNKLSKK